MFEKENQEIKDLILKFKQVKEVLEEAEKELQAIPKLFISKFN